MARNWRSTRNYRVWRVKVIRRDKKCTVCGMRKGLQAHHIQNGSHHPGIRYDIANGITLCGRGCHQQLHTNYKKSYRQKTTEKDWDNFKELAEHYIMVGRLQIINQDI